MDGRIRARDVRVVDVDGTNRGVMPLRDALALAGKQGLNLVEIAPNATPPVCRIVDIGKYRYELAKKEKESRKHQHANRLKEVKFHVNIGHHDYKIKLQRAEEFLRKGCKVKASVFFRGREMVHPELGVALMKRFIQDCATFSTADAQPRMMGRSLNVMMTASISKQKQLLPTPTGTTSPSSSPSLASQIVAR